MSIFIAIGLQKNVCPAFASLTGTIPLIVRPALEAFTHQFFKNGALIRQPLFPE